MKANSQLPGDTMPTVPTTTDEIQPPPIVKTRSSLVLASALAFCLAGFQSVRADPTNFIASLSGNGVLSWTNQPEASSYTIHWAPTASGPWSSNWTGFQRVEPARPLMQAAVPMFYRVSFDNATNTLLLHGDGTNGSWDITDAAGHAVGRSGDTQISTNQSKFGGGSIQFDGAGDFLSLPASADWALGTSDFTVDFWVQFSAAPGTVHLIGSHTAGTYSEWAVVYSGNAVSFLMKNSVVLTYGWTPALNTWHHLAVTRAGGIVSLIVNGRLVGAAANYSDLQPGARALTIGATDNNAYFLNGYLDEIRINKGTAYWSAGFTLPASPYAK